MHPHPHIHPGQSLLAILFSLLILILSYQLTPVTYQGKCTITGLAGLVVGVVIGLVKMMLQR